MYFYDSATRTRKQLAPGIVARTFWGDKMLVALVDLEAGCAIPPHSHPHEQIGMVISGAPTFTIGGETRQVYPGDVYVIPGGVEHNVILGDTAAQVVETFAPVREEYKY